MTLAVVYDGKNERNSKNMNDTHFYREWLHIDVSDGEIPNYYEVLGLENAEPNLQVIREALDEKLNCLYHVNRKEEAEAYTRISGQVLDARYTLLDSARKHAYDTDLLATQGGRAWKSYQRPSLWVRCQQFALITAGFVLGCCIMVMMAMMVERNPDGSIVYRAEVKVEKPKPFTTPLEMVVYRPMKAHDFQEKGYAVAFRSMETGAEAEVFALTSAGEVVTEENAGVEDLAQMLLPDEKGTEELNSVKTPENSTVVAESEAVASDDFEDFNMLASTVKPSKMVQARNPLYDRVRRTATAKTETTVPEIKESELETEKPKVADTAELEDLTENLAGATETVKDEEEVTPEVTEIASLLPEGETEGVENVMESAFSPDLMLDMIEDVAQKVKETEPSAQESLLLVQYQMCLQLATKCLDESVQLSPEFVTRFVQYTLEVARNLNQKKHFTKVAELLVALNTLGENRAFATEVLTEVSTWQNEMDQYQKNVEQAREIFVQLQTKPDDPMLNTQYAMWLWREKKDFNESLPYLEKCQHKSIRTVALLERQVMGNVQYAQNPKYILQVGDRWWSVAELINNPSQKRFVMEHARDLYRKVDQKLLNEQQQLRIASLDGTIKK